MPERTPQFRFGLSAREVEILDAFCEVGHAKGVAERLGVSPRTVEVHAANIRAKMGKDTTLACAVAWREGSQSVATELNGTQLEKRKQSLRILFALTFVALAAVATITLSRKPAVYVESLIDSGANTPASSEAMKQNLVQVVLRFATMVLVTTYLAPSSLADANLSLDFSTVQNPNGAWVYGKIEGDQFEAFTDNTTLTTWYAGGLPNVRGWSVPGGVPFPYAAKNVGTTDYVGSTTWYAGEVVLASLHPGRKAVARWTSSISGTTRISGYFRRINGGPNTATYEVTKNGSVLTSGSLFQLNEMNTFAQDVQLVTGDVVDVVASYETHSDGTGIATNVLFEALPVVAPPTAVTVQPGIVLAGGVNELVTSNDAYMFVRPGPVLFANQFPIRMTVEGVSPVSAPSRVRVRYEYAASATGIRAIAQAFNFTSGAWVQISNDIITLNDVLQEHEISTNAAQFVEPGTGRILFRLSFNSTGPVLFWPRNVRVDLVNWYVYP